MEYFWIGIKAAWSINIFRYTLLMLLTLFLAIILRRLFIVLQSGGKFFAPYHIAREKLFIHKAIFFHKRIIPLGEINRITVNCIHGIKLNGRRYILSIERKHGRTMTVIFGKTKKNDKLVEDLNKQTKKYPIKIHRGLQD